LVHYWGSTYSFWSITTGVDHCTICSLFSELFFKGFLYDVVSLAGYLDWVGSSVWYPPEAGLFVTMIFFLKCVTMMFITGWLECEFS
jgi:hypothetical protein